MARKRSLAFLLQQCRGQTVMRKLDSEPISSCVKRGIVSLFTLRRTRSLMNVQTSFANNFLACFSNFSLRGSFFTKISQRNGFAHVNLFALGGSHVREKVDGQTLAKQNILFCSQLKRAGNKLPFQTISRGKGHLTISKKSVHEFFWYVETVT
jgi:hypothetical protein